MTTLTPAGTQVRTQSINFDSRFRDSASSLVVEFTQSMACILPSQYISNKMYELSKVGKSESMDSDFLSHP